MVWFTRFFWVGALMSLLAACASTPEEARDFRDYRSIGVEDIYYTTPESDGKRIHAITNVKPDAPAKPWRVIAITGAPGDHSYWSPLFQNIGQEVDLTVMRRPGYGPDDRAPVFDVDAHVAAVLPLLDAAAPGQKTLLVGQSFGAGVAIRTAGLYPEKIDALMLLSAFLLEPNTEAQQKQLKFVKRVRFLIGAENRRAIKELDFHPTLMASALEQAPNVQDPVVILHGSADEVAPPANAEYARDVLPSATCAEIIWVPDAWHYIANDPDGVVSDGMRRAMGKTCG